MLIILLIMELLALKDFVKCPMHPILDALIVLQELVFLGMRAPDLIYNHHLWLNHQVSVSLLILTILLKLLLLQMQWSQGCLTGHMDLLTKTKIPRHMQMDLTRLPSKTLNSKT